jgi:hypothetical protein
MLDEILNLYRDLTEFEKSVIEAKLENFKQLLIYLDYDLYKDIFISKEYDIKVINNCLTYISD